MATYVMGDVHGCFDTLRALWRRLPFDPSRDRLWLAGDLANRGPGSLEALRWARGMAGLLGPRFAAVLGNHDLHLLRRAEGLRPAKPRDTLEPILDAADGRDLVEWVARLPLLHRGRVEHGGGGVRDWVLVHAGLWPGWSPEAAERAARRAERWLADPALRRRALDLDSVAAGPVAAPDATRPGEEASEEASEEAGDTSDDDQAAVHRALYAFTELRTLHADGSVCDDFSGPPWDAPPGCVPWFRHPARATAWPQSTRVAFGHWAALGYHRGDGVLALDTAAIWGGGLTAVRLEDGAVFHQETVEPPAALP